MNKLLTKNDSVIMITEKIFTMHFWQGIFTGAGYVVESNKEHGEGQK